MPLRMREVIEQVLGAHLRIDAKLLRQVAERLAHFILLIQHVDARRAWTLPLSGSCKRGQDAHQRGLAGAVGAEQAVHPRRNREGHVLQRLHAVGIGLRYAADLQCHSFSPTASKLRSQALPFLSILNGKPDSAILVGRG